MTAAPDQCEYTHDVSSFSDFEEDVWHCPYQSYEHEQCLFHSPTSEKTDEDVTNALITAIRNPESIQVTENSANVPTHRSRKAFIGGQFGDVDLSHTLLDPGDNQPIDFRDCVFEGRINCSYLETRSPLWFDGAVINGLTTFDETVFEKEVRFDNVAFRGDVSFFDSRFEADAHFTATSFESLVTFYAATFERDGKFTDSTFYGHAKFSGVRFDGKAQFGRSVFYRRSRFNKTRFRSVALFDDATFDHVVTYTNAIFADQARFNGARFFDQAVFNDVDFEEIFSFIGGTISALATFEEAQFERTAAFSGVLQGRLSLNHAQFGGELRVSDIDTGERSMISLRNSTIPSGALACSTPSGVPVGYDLRFARVGDINLTGGERLGVPLFENVLLEQTTFDGFDFGDYNDELTATSWTLHTDWENTSQSSVWTRLLVPSVLHRPFELAGSGLSADDRAATYSRYEGTYLRAKNGAKQVGFSQASGDFFIRELTYRRRKLFWQIFTGGRPSSLRAAYQWTASSLLGASSGYGERPSYVILTSAILIAVFSLLYNAIAPALYAEPLTFLSLSIGAFVTLLFGSPGAIADYPVVSTLAHLEGIIGAFLIALFVFTLTRSLHR